MKEISQFVLLYTVLLINWIVLAVISTDPIKNNDDYVQSQLEEYLRLKKVRTLKKYKFQPQFRQLEQMEPKIGDPCNYEIWTKYSPILTEACDDVLGGVKRKKFLQEKVPKNRNLTAELCIKSSENFGLLQCGEGNTCECATMGILSVFNFVAEDGICKSGEHGICNGMNTNMTVPDPDRNFSLFECANQLKCNFYNSTTAGYKQRVGVCGSGPAKETYTFNNTPPCPPKATAPPEEWRPDINSSIGKSIHSYNFDFAFFNCGLVFMGIVTIFSPY